MWLEELAWVWLPIISGLGVWTLWNIVTLRTQVRMLQERVQQFEDAGTVQGRARHKVA
jgi:hypothetical protein